MLALTNKQVLLLQLLLEKKGDFVTSQFLANKMDVSVRTVKTYIQHLNEDLYDTGIEIMSSPRKGYQLKADDNVNWQEIHSSLGPISNEQSVNVLMGNDKRDRIQYLIMKLLSVDYPIRFEDLMDELYISRSTLTAYIREVRGALGRYRLKISSKANYGIYIEGSETDKRLCICEYFFHQKDNDVIHNKNLFNSGKTQQEYNKIVQTIEEVCQECNINLSDFSINNLAIHISIGMRRCKFFDYVKVEDETILRFQNTIDYRAADLLVKQLEEQFSCMLPVGETVYYAMHFQSKRVLDTIKMDNEERTKLENCIHIIFEEVNNNFGLELKKDTELYRYLFLHIPQMVQRLNNHMVMRNPFAHDNIRRYLFATKVTHSAVEIIEQFYNIKVDENEFGYLLLYFNLSILKQEKKKFQIGVLCGLGRPESIMYFNEIKESFSSRQYNVVYLEKQDLTTTKLDLLVTNFNLTEKVDAPIYMIHNDTYLEEIHKRVEDIEFGRDRLSKYFQSENVCIDLEGDSKEAVLHNLYEYMLQHDMIRKIPSEEQQLRDDELGNGIVHLQDLYRIIRKEMCFVAVLKHAVYWNNSMIRFIVIVKTKKDGDQDLPLLCKLVSHWANNVKEVERLWTNRDLETFIRGIDQ